MTATRTAHSFLPVGAIMEGRTRELLSWGVWWSAVFAANTALPLSFGLSTTNEGAVRPGQLGVWVGAWLVWAGWLVIGSLSTRVRLALTLGGAVVALTQVVPVLQYAAACLGYGVADRLLGRMSAVSPFFAESEYKGVVAAAITGQSVVALLLVVGYVLRPRPRRRLVLRRRRVYAPIHVVATRTDITSAPRFPSPPVRRAPSGRVADPVSGTDASTPTILR